MPEIVSKLLRAASEVALLFDSNLSIPFLGQVVDLDLLLCTGFDLEHAVLFLCHIFTQRPMNDRKIERNDGRCFGRQQLPADSNGSSISNEKKICRHGRYPQRNKSFLTLELSRCRKSGSTFSPSEPVPATRCPQRLPPTRKRPVFVLARPTRASRAGARPQELGH